jgi:very-short-patch-repair endonuclease
MILYYPHTVWKKESGKKNNGAKMSTPRVRVCCDNCKKEFVERVDIFNKRLNLIEREYCGKCSRPLVARLAGLKGNYDEGGKLKENSGRYTSEKWNNLTDEERNVRNLHNKKIAIAFHAELQTDPDKKTKQYEKVFKKSFIGYISKGQTELYNILKVSGFQSEVVISGLRVDMVNLDTKVVVEYNGDFWHCNPSIWKESKYNKAIKLTAGEKWKKDRARRFVLMRLGFQVYTVWERDWKTDRATVYKMLQEVVGVDYIFPAWTYEPKQPLKGRTFEEIYGTDRARVLKENRSKRSANRVFIKDAHIEIITPNQGVFYTDDISDWHKKVVGSWSKKVKYNRVEKSNGHTLWNREEIVLDLTI